MPKNKHSGRHLQFYNDCMINGGVMPFLIGVNNGGLCLMAECNQIDKCLFDLFSYGQNNCTYWADELTYSRDSYKTRFVFNTLRQTIVLLMAAINNEL